MNTNYRASACSKALLSIVGWSLLCVNGKDMNNNYDCQRLCVSKQYIPSLAVERPIMGIFNVAIKFEVNVALLDLARESGRILEQLGVVMVEIGGTWMHPNVVLPRYGQLHMNEHVL